MTTYVFPGQGSQAKGMGATLFPEFSELVQKADAILGYSIGDLCTTDPKGELNQTNFTQPALYVVNALSYFKLLKDPETQPKFVAGHSLGEYNALLAAGVFDFETGLKLVQKRGDLMSKATGGGMAAVVGLKGDVVQSLIESNQLSNISVANYNTHTQIVISGTKEAILSAEPIFTKAGAAMYIPLKVSGAFHSPFMKPAAEEFSHFIKTFKFEAPKIQVIANVDARPFQADNVISNLTQQISSPVRWTQTIDYLMSQGESDFIEVGPGKVLTGLIARIKKGQ